jgi:lipopolysaccharide transport system ATP-binding protein
MIDRELQIGICGTFDVENYGDILFPLVAEAELSRRLKSVRLHRFSYFHKTPPDWLYDVSSVADLPSVAGSLDGMIIGGGHIIRFDKEIAPGYLPPVDTIHHPTGYWLTPALISLQYGLPVAWNAPGVHGEIPEWAEPLMHIAIKLSNYVSVRDEPSRQALLPFAGESKIAVVPDTAFGVAQMLNIEQPSSDFIQLREKLGLKDKYIVVHAVNGLDPFPRLVKKRPRLFQDYQLVALPLGPVLGDNDIDIANDLPGVISLPSWPDPLLLAELIGHSSAVIGLSLHLALTALAFGVPVFRPAWTFHGKYSPLSNFDTVMPFDYKTGTDPKWFAARLGRKKPSSSVSVAINQLSDHWDNVAAVFAAGERQPVTLQSLGNFWQSLPNLLEGWSTRCDAIAEERNSAIAAHKGEAQESNKQLAATSTQADEYYDGYNLTLRKITSSIRSLGRRLRLQKPVKD